MSRIKPSVRHLYAGCLCFAWLLVSSPSSADEVVKLSDLWKPGPNGVIIELPQTTKLIVDQASDGKPYILKGRRLVIRVATMEVVSGVTIASWRDTDVPAKIKGFDNTAPNGTDGVPDGGAGAPGQAGKDGATGDAGFNAGPITLEIGALSGPGWLIVDGRGGTGGTGQDGQQGGKGGRSGRGKNSHSTAFDCKSGGGNAGPAGSGGEGGMGGRGGAGGAGATVRISRSVDDVSSRFGETGVAPMPMPGRLTLIYAGGAGGAPGSGGLGGDGGDGNDGGSGGGWCHGGHGAPKGPTPPQQTKTLGAGHAGRQGTVVVID